MLGDVQDVCCNKCGKYLFTEMDTATGYRRENDKGDYIYLEYKDVFLCDECKPVEGR